MFVRRLRAFFGALPPRQFPHHVELAPLLARFSSDDQFEFGLRTFLAGLIAQQPRLAPSRSPDATNVTASDETLPQPSTRSTQGGAMPDKSPQNHNTKVGRSLRDKRVAKTATSDERSLL